MRKLVSIGLVASVAVSLAACGSSSQSAASSSTAGAATSEAASTEAASTEAATTEETGSTESTASANVDSSAWDNYELKLSTNLAEDHIACQGYYAFADAVEEATDGHVKITIYSGEQLGKESDVTSSISMNAGTCDIVCCGPSELSKYNSTFTLFDAPYIFDDGDSMLAFANGEDVQGLYDELAESSNLRCLGMYYYGAREVTTNGYPATTPDGLKGCKLRVPDSEMALAYGAALGATPTVMSLSEVYMGIQQGVVDGQENPLPTIDANAYYEVCDNLLMTDHVIAAVTYTIDNTVWESMPEDLQNVIKQCVEDSCDSISEDIKAQEAELKTSLADKGMNVIEVDKEAFQANAQSVYDTYMDSWGDWYDKAKAANE